MKIEFLKSGSPDCPLIRLYEFKPSEAQALRRIALQLARGRIQRVPLHNEQGILAIGGCQLALSREERDRGVFETGPLEFMRSEERRVGQEMRGDVSTDEAQ